MKKLAYQLWFHNLTLTNEIKAKIFETKISQEEFYHYTLREYIASGFNIIKAQEIQDSKNIDKYMDTVEYLTKEQIDFIAYDNDKFPIMLKLINNPPTGLFIKGKLPTLENTLAIVGARNASEYGKTAAYKISSQLSSKGICIVSGMARGIDSSAHNGAMLGVSPTIAVMGSGFMNIYPKENLSLFNKIVEKGCVITEYMPYCLPMPYNFPLRNRIISGLSKFILVIEAGERSGSLTTATLAQEQGKDVFAIPGNIYSPKSIGTNKLIRDGAKIITEIDDIYEEFHLLSTKQSSFESISNTKSSETQFQTYNGINATSNPDVILENQILFLLKNGAASLDMINEELHTKIDRILAVLTRLECSGQIKRMYGKYYISV